MKRLLAVVAAVVATAGLGLAGSTESAAAPGPPPRVPGAYGTPPEHAGAVPDPGPGRDVPRP
ncbi:hypothetical protein AB0G74_04015 [Streptomyces sp. NPDC020875]|uniref:hypothetical protein n=1 Tax=Streptomyces sp. NPDC020875 TaxID=3154898 RepID=UPI0033C90787